MVYLPPFLLASFLLCEPCINLFNDVVWATHHKMHFALFGVTPCPPLSFPLLVDFSACNAHPASCRCGTHTPISVSVLSIWTPAGCGLALSRFSQSFISTSGLHWLPPPFSVLPSRIDLPLIYMEVGAAQTIPPHIPRTFELFLKVLKCNFQRLKLL